MSSGHDDDGDSIARIPGLRAMEASANAQGEEESSVPSRVHFYEGLGLPEVGKEIAALEAAK